MSSDADDPSLDLPTTTIARRGPSEDDAPAANAILEGEASDWVTIQCYKLLCSFYQKPGDENAHGRYLGMNAITLKPVFTTGSIFIQRPGGKQCAVKDILLDEKLLRSDRVIGSSSLKSTSVDIQSLVPGQKRRKRFPASPSLRPPMALDADDGEAHRMKFPLRLGNIREYQESGFFRLTIPCLGSTQIPEPLVLLAQAIQASLHQHNLHLHVVVMAIIVWVDIHFEPTQKGRVRFPPQKLVNFVTFWPHYLRFHEVFYLSIYCHPCHFAEAFMPPHLLIHHIPPDDRKAWDAWEEEAKILVDLCRLHPRTNYVQMLPSSWPGSTLTLPGDAENYGFAAPTAALARSLGQPSIHIIGHPVYPRNGPLGITLLLPRTWMSPAIKSAVPLTTTTISDEVIRPERHGRNSLCLITGEVLDIFPRPEDLEPLATIPTRPSPTQSPRPTTQQQEDHTNLHTDDRVGIFWEHFASPEFHQAQMEAQNSKLQAAIAAGVTIDQLTFDEHNLLSWPAVNPAATTPEPTPAPLLSAELAAEVRVVVSTYLQSSHRHQEYRNFKDLVEAAEDLEVALVREALKRAVHQTQMLKETMEEFVRSFHSQALMHDGPTDWTFCRGIAPKFLVPLLHLVGADELATQPVQMLTPERVCEAVEGIADVHKFILNLLAPGTAVCEPGSRVLIDECIPLTTYWMKSLLKSFPFKMLGIFQKLLESFPEDD